MDQGCGSGIVLLEKGHPVPGADLWTRVADPAREGRPCARGGFIDQIVDPVLLGKGDPVPGADLWTRVTDPGAGVLVGSRSYIWKKVGSGLNIKI